MLHTDFLFVENVRQDSDSANAETLFALLNNKKAELDIETNKVSSLVSGGASVVRFENRSCSPPERRQFQNKLQDIVHEKLPLKQFKQDLEAEDRLATLELTTTEF